ncbi:hypothetical protein RSOLAG22IIIB_02660 [Rhizoctonia solani]|uniref:non-specific serine/threonine protein kinase n=1 Tax=Rhizoctonia solani TaxID=456999 RepID=A0A0K6GHR3_9AGAM|nr:hypothetical protein RSOLAG22IIIB_02660 [Rhizoctonia solani]
MTCTDVVNLLTKHDCTDLSSSLDTSVSSEYPIATGGLGDVFLGQLNDGTSVAIKTIRAYESSNNLVGTYQKRAAREVYTWSKCKHRNVVRLLGLAVFRNSLAMISRWEENGNLLSYLSRHSDADRCHLSRSIVPV